MKINKLFLTAGLFVVALTSCTDLDVTPNSQYTEDPSKNSGIDPTILIEAKMANIYYHMAGTLGRRYMDAHCLASDEFTALAFDGGYYDEGTYAHQALHDSRATDGALDWYSEVTAGITNANKILKEIYEEQGEDADIIMTAPARAMRAYFTWILMDSFGDAPIIESAPAEGEVVPRSPRKEVAEWIEKELQEIIPGLTEDVTEKTYGKPTRWMAEALLAKLYINWAVYTAESVDQYDAATATNEKLESCIAACDDIINSGKFNLGGSVDYLHKFSYDNGSFVGDFIYAMPYDVYTLLGFQYGRPRSFKQLKGMLPTYYGFEDKFTQSFGGNMVVTPEFAQLFCLEGDIRNLCILRGDVFIRDPKTLKPTSEPFMYNGKQVHFTETITLKKQDNTIEVGNDDNAIQQGCHSIKWYVNPAEYNIKDETNSGRNQSNDLPIFRFADILLMKAEALTRLGHSGAMDLFNQIRTYAGAPTISAEPTLDEIYDERGREFFDENWRRNDMIRFGHFEDEFFPHYKGFPDANFDKRHRIFPVEQEMLDLNPGWEQNPGY